MRLRTSLLLLVAGTAVPLVTLAAVLAYLLLAQEADTFKAGARDRNRAFITAVDAELRGNVASLRALAASSSLEADDLRAFHAEAARFAATQPDWKSVVLADASGQVLVDTTVPDGTPLGRVRDAPSFEAAVATRAPVIGHVASGRHGNFAVPLRVPVLRDGTVRYVVSVPLRPEAFARLIAAQHFPREWAIALLDDTGRFIARVPQRPAGELGSPDLRDAIASSGEGWFRGRTLEGLDAYSAHRTSSYSRWTVAVGVPASHFLAATYRTALYTALGALLSIAVAVAFAGVMGARIARPIAAVAARARALARGGAPAVTLETTAIAEIREVEHALAEAGDAIVERESLRDREEVALKAADRAKDEFLAMLGHELRNPLSAITASAHVLRLARPGDAIAQNAHAVIERQAGQMTRLVEDLMDVSRLVMGKIRLAPEPLDLAEIAAHVAATWLAAGRRRGDRLAVSGTSAWVHADRARIEQVITNLLDNADKFSPPGSAIGLRVASEDATAVLEVSDRGEGIDPAMLERIFDPFVQAPQDLSRTRGGMGLGLALVRRLVAMHGGTVTAASDGHGTGARFVVRLPRIAAPASSAAGIGPAAAPASARRILVVEDNEDARAMLATMLALEGHVVVDAANGATALARAAEFHPDVAIVDIGLPDFDGYELARRLRESGRRELRLLSLSGYGQVDDERRSYQAGFDLHLTKPVDPAFLRDVLAALASGERAPARASSQQPFATS